MSDKWFYRIAVIVLILILVDIAINKSQQPEPVAVSEDKGYTGEAQIGGSFTLTGQDGAQVSDTDFAGKYRLVYFGFTNCPMICPTDVNNISQTMVMLDEKGLEGKVAPIFITVDPARDTAEALKGFLSNFHPSFVGLTGDEATLKDVRSKYKAFSAKIEDPDFKDGYQMDHSAFIYLMDGNGTYVAHFSHATEPEKMAAKIAEAISSSKN